MFASRFCFYLKFIHYTNYAILLLLKNVFYKVLNEFCQNRVLNVNGQTITTKITWNRDILSFLSRWSYKVIYFTNYSNSSNFTCKGEDLINKIYEKPSQPPTWNIGISTVLAKTNVFVVTWFYRIYHLNHIFIHTYKYWGFVIILYKPI